MTFLRSTRIEAAIDAGKKFSAGFTFVDVGTGTTVELLVVTPASPSVRMKGIITITVGPGEVFLFEDATVTGAGTGLTELDANRQTANTSVATVAHTPTTSDDGNQIGAGLLTGTSDNRLAFGDTIDSDDFTVLKVSEDYLIRVLNDSGSNSDIRISLTWTEGA